MDNGSEPDVDNEIPYEEEEEPQVEQVMQLDSDDEDEFPEFGNDENKKLF